jgi:hypothetical protein
MSLFVFNSVKLPSTRVPHKSQWPTSASHVRTLFGQHVLWCPLSKGGSHLSEKELEPYRHIGDPLVDDLLERIDQQGSPLSAGGDLLELIGGIERGDDDTTLSPQLQKDLIAFLATCRTVPEWVNVEQLNRGRTVFLTYAPAIGAALYYRSLVPGFSIPNIAAVIQSTRYLASDQVTSRLTDTGALLSSCMTGTISTLFEGGNGWKAALYVRVLHAKVRRALLKRSKPKWDTSRLGVPINQEDMAATLLAFSVNALVGVEFVSGIPMKRQEQLDYLALWRYIGWLLGVHTVTDEDFSGKLRPLDPCGPGWFANGDPTVHSRSILMSVIFHLMKPDESSVTVANHLLKIGRSQDQDENSKDENKRIAWFYFRSLQCRRFIGDPLADALQLARHDIWWKRWLLFLVSTSYLSLLRMYTLAAMLCPPAKRRMQRWHLHSLTRFHEYWTKSHQTRMAKALGKEKDQMETPASCCPFAMVAPPEY